MSPKALACDTTLLSYFAYGGIFHVLHTLFAGRLHVPPTVATEAGRVIAVGQAVVAAYRDGWLVRVDISPEELAVALRLRQNYALDAGEAEAVALAASRGLVLVCDERVGRAAAAKLGVAGSRSNQGRVAEELVMTTFANWGRGTTPRPCPFGPFGGDVPCDCWNPSGAA